MAGLVRFVLNDGRSLLAGCGSTRKESLARVLTRPGVTLKLKSGGDVVEQIATDDIRDFVIFDVRSSLAERASEYDLDPVV